MTASPPAGVADLSPLARAREQKAWYWYDWANSAYVTTIGTVLFAPYLISVAEQAACGFVTDEDKGLKCDANLHVLGLGVSPGSLVFYVVTIATILSAARCCRSWARLADRSASKKAIMAGFAWAGQRSPRLMFFVHRRRTGSSARSLLIVANICLGASLVVLRRDPVRDLRRATSGTGSPRAAGRWATSAAACCSPSTSRW